MASPSEGPASIMLNRGENGPPDSGHGGIAAGRAAGLADAERARVRLHAPIPLATPMIATLQNDGSHELLVAGDLVMSRHDLDEPMSLQGFAPLAERALIDAESRSFANGSDHPYPTCWGCGNHRPDGTGLGLRPGPIEDESMFATRWTPGIEGQVSPWLVWAALDCPSGAPAIFAAGQTDLALTGELSVQIHGPVDGEDEYQILSRQAQRNGRKITSEAALVDSNGVTIASAWSIWIMVSRST
ncbi:MAG: hypothetical protein IH940_00735 [Acidobacteria bacterium]|nr:hypothetical protein [Acidobacteriota bacterium]